MNDKSVARLQGIGLVKAYGKRTVVNEVNIEVSQNEIVGLLGPNGAGKTTTFYMIVGMVKPKAGTVLLNGKNITSRKMYQRARLGISYLPQESSIFRKLTVEQNLMAILETMHLSRSQRREKCDSLLEELSISHLRKSKAYNLSGGERRRTEIARCLVTDPKFLLFDEPFAGIDPIAVQDIQKIVEGLKDRGIGVLITDHNVHETLAITNRAYLLYEGRILKSGTSEFVAKDSEARELYLGDSFSLSR
ncbi:MAG: LPS export ABC transporter ATP-binding protein [Candidatus Electryonea clarkiae]|nr:LPS export ABC transporter ATP-binding protein [Candidatus Electryonea clarkiae]MDP8289039.1 LPS export ABC transporter ATP-binding protein [Candidatus Electryonea clarkiae]